MVKNKLIPKFRDTVKDINKKHPAVTISKCNTDGFSVLCPGTTYKQGNTTSIIHIEPTPSTGLDFDTYFLLRMRFSIREKVMCDTNFVNRIGRLSPAQFNKLEKKINPI
jgi:hypothetical protein